MLRLMTFLIVLMLILSAFTASAVAFTQGNMDAGIAFLWPALAIAMVLGMAMPKGKAV